MRIIPSPVSTEELTYLYVDEKLTDEAIAQKLGGQATAKRVRAWRKRAGISTLRRTDRNTVPPIEGRLRSLLVGSMLGDGRLSRTPNAARYMENHADAQRDYLAWKMAQWGEWAKRPMSPVTWHKGPQDFHGWRFETVSHTSLLEWHSLFYAAVGPKRLVSRVVDLVDAFALAVWFLDDGTAGWWPYITFGLDPNSRAIAFDIFAKFSLFPKWSVRKGNTGVFTFEGEAQAQLFLALVKPHIPDCMARKLDFGFQGRHYQIRQALPVDLLREMALKGVPIRQIAKQTGISASVVSRHLIQHGIAHPRKVGSPRRV